MLYLLALFILMLTTPAIAEPPVMAVPGLKQGDPITVYKLAPGTTSYWDQHGNNVQVNETTLPGLSTYSGPGGSGTIYEPLADRPLEAPKFAPPRSIERDRCPPGSSRVYC